MGLEAAGCLASTEKIKKELANKRPSGLARPRCLRSQQQKIAIARVRGQQVTGQEV